MSKKLTSHTLVTPNGWGIAQVQVDGSASVKVATDSWYDAEALRFLAKKLKKLADKLDISQGVPLKVKGE